MYENKKDPANSFARNFYTDVNIYICVLHETPTTTTITTTTTTKQQEEDGFRKKKLR